jgi:hypothetical protein
VADSYPNAIDDISGEYGFAAGPIYQIYPDLWRLFMRRLESANPPPARSAKTDASFRKAKAAAGRLRFTPAAIGYLRAYEKEVRKDSIGCQVIVIDWEIGEKFKGPDDAAWKSLPPAVGIGSYWCQYLPPDAVQTIKGIRIIVGGSEPDRLAGKLIDLKKDKLVLEDR